jgi:hypothetical protein
LARRLILEHTPFSDGVHLVIKIHSSDLELSHALIHVVQLELEHGELSPQRGDVAIFIIFLMILLSLSSPW